MRNDRATEDGGVIGNDPVAGTDLGVGTAPVAGRDRVAEKDQSVGSDRFERALETPTAMWEDDLA
jgi:hypothetical protein